MGEVQQVVPLAQPRGRVTKDFAWDVKADEANAGVFDGYASVFNVVDSEGDVILPGAFTRSLQAWRAKGRAIPVLWQHDGWAPIGVTEAIEEDEHGLRVRGRLVLDVRQAAEAHALMRAGALGGLSIGFSVPTTASDGQASVVWDEERRARTFREVRLWEYSLVTWPANEDAQLLSVRQARAEQQELRDAIKALSSATMALAAASVALPTPAAAPTGSDLTTLLDAVKRHQARMKGA